jgi:hypothetical protein
MSIMSILLVMLVNAFLGSRKTQGQAVSMMSLKVAGSQALEKMYLELSQGKRLLASMDVAPAGEDIGLSYFNQMEIPMGMLAPIPAGNLRFPRVAPNGKFTAMGTGSGQLAPWHIGNALVLVTRAPEIPLATSGVKMKYGSAGALRELTPEKPFRLNRFRFVAYYLTEVPIRKDMPAINGTMRHTMNLVRWESRMYVEKAEIEGVLNQVPHPPDRKAIWKDLTDKYLVAGAWDSAATDATKALFEPTGATSTMTPLAGAILKQYVKPVTTLDLQPYALGMVAFNTNDNFKPLDSLKSSGTAVTLQVPTFGEAGTPIPYGFEVGIIGSNAARTVLLKLSLAARLSAGNKIFGWSNQQIVQMMDN